MPPAVHIREAAPGDDGPLALVGTASFLESFAGALDGGDILAHCQGQHAPHVYSAWLADDAYKIWLALAEPGEAPVGYLVLGPAELPLADLTAGDWEVKRVYVLSRFQGAGLGRSLIELAKAEASRRGGRRLLLGVYAKNDRAIAFYHRQGFTEVGTRTFQVGRHQYHDQILATPLTS